MNEIQLNPTPPKLNLKSDLEETLLRMNQKWSKDENWGGEKKI